MDSQLVCIQGKTYVELKDDESQPIETKQRIDLQFHPSFAKIKMVSYKAESSVFPGDNPSLSNITINPKDILSDVLFLHCSLWPSTPIALLTSPHTLICPDITLPLLGQGISGGLHTFCIRDNEGQLADIVGNYSVLIEFHK